MIESAKKKALEQQVHLERAFGKALYRERECKERRTKSARKRKQRARIVESAEQRAL